MTSAIPIDILCPVRNRLGESPIWSVSEQALYWVDIEGRRIHRYDWAKKIERSWPVVERIGCIALYQRGGLLAAMESGVFRVPPLERGEALTLELVDASEFPRDDMRFNDGRTDREGRFWVSSMVRDTSLGVAAGGLYRLDDDGLSVPLVEGLITGNGLAFSPDGRTMYLADSHPTVRRIWTFALSIDGVPGERREFIDMNRHPGRPDGAAVDADGCYWICATDAGRIHRFTPAGVLDQSIAMPVAKPTMCAFGGPQLKHLFVTSMPPATAVPDFDPALAGAVFVLEPGVRGLPEAYFRY